MRKHKKDIDFVHKPFYKGGKEALKAFIAKNLVYPKEALEHKISGNVSLRYKINHKGKTHSIKVISGLGYGCDNEACRIVENLKYEVPKTHKLKVSYNKKINIHFRLNNQALVENKDNKQSISYYIRPSSKQTEKQEKKVYKYTIRI